MAKHFSSNIIFHVIWLCFLIPATLFLFTFSKGNFSLFINQFHSREADCFFKTITHLAEFIVILPVIVLLLFVKFKYALALSINLIITLLITSILKQLFNEPRPISFFEPTTNLHFADGVILLKSLSFPSGHASGAFTLFFTLSFFTQNNIVKSIYCILAICVAISRVYLLQHFLIDVYAGSILGILVTHLMMLFYHKKTTLFTSTKLNQSLATIWKNTNSTSSI